MIRIFKRDGILYVVSFTAEPDVADIEKLYWLFGQGTKQLSETHIKGKFLGTRAEMITPWSSNAVEICRNMGINKIVRIETFLQITQNNVVFDKMLQSLYDEIGQNIFDNPRHKQPNLNIVDVDVYNKQYGLALHPSEISYLQKLSHKIGRPLTDAEVYGFSQVNSEHCRHKIFRGKFYIDGIEQTNSLFDMIKSTSQKNPDIIVSAYSDNVAFIQGPPALQFSPKTQFQADFFKLRPIQSVISLKAETHNFPTTVEPFYGASTGSGGEIRDRMAGGRGSIPLAGTAVYCTSYSRIQSSSWEKAVEPRNWLYKSPDEILIKASNGASDFGNKFGQPLICGSVLTFEHTENKEIWGYDKVIMLAGGIGYADSKNALKQNGKEGDIVVLLGGENYRIGMGGGAVSSVSTGELTDTIELNAVQRANPEMQKRAYNVIRALAEETENPVISIHDHGAGGHLNCFSELMETTGGIIEITKLPLGDPSLSSLEIICNESQERMGLLVRNEDMELLEKIAQRERAPLYVVGRLTNDKRLVFLETSDSKPFDLPVDSFIGHDVNTIIKDKHIFRRFSEPEYKLEDFEKYLTSIFMLESVACKDWLTNKVDRSVTGKIAMQQTCGALQLPLNNCGVTTIDYSSVSGVATSIGHAPIAGMIDAGTGSILAVAEALTNLVWAPLKHGLSGIALSANWMWASDQKGEAVRLFEAVKSLSNFAVELGIPVPTGKDSLFMTQKYPEGKQVVAPGTVIVSAAAEVSDIRKTVSPVLRSKYNTTLFLVRFTNESFELGGSSFYQVLSKIGKKTPTLTSAEYFRKTFTAIQSLLKFRLVLAGHDISAGGLITTLFEMCFANPHVGMDIDLTSIQEDDLVKLLFSESPGVVIQVEDSKLVIDKLIERNIEFYHIGKVIERPVLKIRKDKQTAQFQISSWRDIWYSTSYQLDKKQTTPKLAKKRFDNYKKNVLEYHFTDSVYEDIKKFVFPKENDTKRKPKAAIIREKGVNGDREMAFSLFNAGFDVKDIHITDLISGKETLEDVRMIVFVGGFSNSDVLGSARGWAGAFLYNEKARTALDRFYARKDTLSLGVCNGCQLMVELGLIKTANSDNRPRMQHNESGKFESAFLNVTIPENKSVMLQPLAGCRLGVWIAHGEGKFVLPGDENNYCIPMKYSFPEFPGNPNGSDFNAAGICSEDGRHLAIMPHIERSVFPWQWAYYPEHYRHLRVSPWALAFSAAKVWIEKHTKKSNS